MIPEAPPPGPTGRPSTVAAERVGLRIAGTPILEGVDLAACGGITTILGPNGAGKTSLLRCLASVWRPTRGRVTIDGFDPRVESERMALRRRLGYLPQELALDGAARVFDIVDYVAAMKGVGLGRRGPERARRAEVMAVLERVGLDDRAAERVAEVSGGMRRRIGVAQALLGDPGLLLLDEPAVALDPEERTRLRSLLAEQRHRTTILQSTHLTDEAIAGDRVVVLDAGRVTFSGEPHALAARARDRVWIQPDGPGPEASDHWRQPDGSYRCLGTRPPWHPPVDPTLEEGYLVVRGH